MAYAIFRTGGKQHRVSKGDKLQVEKLPGNVGEQLEFADVLFVKTAGEGVAKIGRPIVDGAKVTATIVAQGRGPKILVFKRRRRKGFHKMIGHRQCYTELEITGITGITGIGG